VFEVLVKNKYHVFSGLGQVVWIVKIIAILKSLYYNKTVNLVIYYTDSQLVAAHLVGYQLTYKLKFAE
jgi:hypothetical protein